MPGTALKGGLTPQEAKRIAKITQKRTAKSRLRRSIPLIALLIPGIVFVLIFHYLPMFGLVIGFEKYDIFAGANPIDAVFKSPWVGLKNWDALWVKSKFRQAVVNTFIISALKVGICFPLGIILALMINEVRSNIAKKTLQTVMYLPHFISWVVVGALFMNIMGTTGIVNQVIMSLGGRAAEVFYG